MKALAFLTSLVIAGAWTSFAHAGCRSCNITAPSCGEGYVCAYDEGWGEACCLLETGEPEPDAGPEPTPSPSPWDAGDGGDIGPEPTPSPGSRDAGDGGDADVDGGEPSSCRYVCEGSPDGGDAGTLERCWVCDLPDAGGEGSGGEGSGGGDSGGEGSGGGGSGGEGSGGEGSGGEGSGGEGSGGEGSGGGGSGGGNSNNAGSTARSVAGRPRDRGGCSDSELPPARGLPPLALLALWGLRRRARGVR